MTVEFLFFLLLAHFIGDYWLQSNWMATQKTLRWWPAVAHGLTYGIPFALVLFIYLGFGAYTVTALFVIVSTHIIIDRYRLVKPLIWLKNQAGPASARYNYEEGKDNAGYDKTTPPFLSVWLMIIVDNSLHILINFLAVWSILFT